MSKRTSCAVPADGPNGLFIASSTQKPSRKHAQQPAAACISLHQSQTKSSWGGRIAPVLGAEPDPR